MLSVHETVLSFTDSNDTLKSDNNPDNQTLFHPSNAGKKDELLFSQAGAKLHEFWPPGTIIQTTCADFDDDIYNETLCTSTKNHLDDPSFDSNHIVDSKIAHSSQGLYSNAQSSDQDKVLHDYKSDEIQQQLNARTSCEESVSDSLVIIEDEAGNCIKSNEEIEYDAILEPDLDMSGEFSASPIHGDSQSRSDSREMLIEDVTPSGDFTEPFEMSFQPVSISCPAVNSNNRYPSLEAERNLFPIEEVERDDYDITDSPNASPETCNRSTLNSITLSKPHKDCSDSDLDFESHNGHKPERPSEASDLGYFSLDKDSNPTSVPKTCEKMNQAESDIISSIVQNKNKKNESVNLKFVSFKMDPQLSPKESFTAFSEGTFPDFIAKSGDTIKREDYSYSEGIFIV